MRESSVLPYVIRAGKSQKTLGLAQENQVVRVEQKVKLTFSGPGLPKQQERSCNNEKQKTPRKILVRSSSLSFLSVLCFPLV